MAKGYDSIPTEVKLSDSESPLFEECDETVMTTPPLPLSLREKIERCARVIFPILLAVLLLSGSGALLAKSIHDEYATTTTTTTTTTATTIRAPENHESSGVASKQLSTDLDQQSCVQNLGCRYLGLTGACCPTEEGVYLGCCSNLKEKNAMPKASSTGNASSITSKIPSDRGDDDNAVDVSPHQVDTPHASSTITDSKMCSRNPDCEKLGLTGACCPTDGGVNLGCCSTTSTSIKKDDDEKDASLVAVELPDTTEEKEASTVSGSHSSCARNPSCDKLGLIGECCPTVKGVKLGCCSS